METTATLALPSQNEKPDFRHGSLFFVGTATMLLRYAGFTILTDPNFLHQGEKIHLGYGLHTTRLTVPAMEIEDLPSLDLVVLSHLHEDHFDRVAAEKLDKSVPIVTTRQAAQALDQLGFRATRTLDKWQGINISKGAATLRLTAMPARHAPGLLSRLLPSVNGSLLEFGTAQDQVTFRVYITGDTLLDEQLQEIPRRYNDIDLALLHLGGTRIMGLMLTMDGKQGAEALRIIAPHTAIPIHYNDYPVFKSPLKDFRDAVAAAGLEHKVYYIYHGETYNFEVEASE
jgi:L-ascorbate metabolism protein UlaG (beta-lactamase superfamily)